MPHDELVGCTLGIINKRLKNMPDPKPVPLELLCIGLGVQARRRPIGTELGFQRLQSLV